MSVDALSATPPLLQINISVATGPLRYGASGFLYGLGDDGIPAENTLMPIKPQIAAQKAPNGLQHPNGDAFRVADTYLRAGGRQIQIYIQDIYPHWPYDNLGLNDYLSKVEIVVRAVVANPHRELYAYVPFNEPDMIWYGRTPGQQLLLRQDWKTVYQKIRSLDATGLIVGPNFAVYHSVFIAEFMAFCAEHDCLPDIVSWHELNSDFYADWYQHYDHYRDLEQRLGLSPREIAINEYANFMDLSVPGQLIQWITRFENSKVDACLAYWHAAGDLCNLVVQQNQVTGGWWLYKWYADMTGQTVQVTPPNPRTAGLQAIAALDHEKQHIRVLFGGSSDRAIVLIQGFESASFLGDHVHVTVWSTAWSGLEGASRGPMFEMEGDYSVMDGQISVMLDTMVESSAYSMIITAATEMAVGREHKLWMVSYEAEDAAITQAVIQAGGSLQIPNKNYCSNGHYVGDISHDASRVSFSVSVPTAGEYLLDIFYANPHAATAQQLMQIDDESWIWVEYPPNVGPHFIATKSIHLSLADGAHTITLATYDPSIGRANHSVDLDKIELSLLTAASSTQWYGAEYANLSGSAVIRTSGTGYTGTGYVAGSGNGDAATTFIASVDAHGYYTISLRYAAGPLDSTARMLVNNVPVKVACPATGGWNVWADATVQVFLHAGINRIIVQASGTNAHAIHLDGISVGSGTGTFSTYEAESPANTLNGTARTQHDRYASGGRCVIGIGDGAANYLEFNAIDVASSGTYCMIVHYANAEKIGTHDYNVNIVDRSAQVSVNGGNPKTVYFRNTFAWDSYRTMAVTVQLQAGMNTIHFSNTTASAPHLDKIELALIA